MDLLVVMDEEGEKRKLLPAAGGAPPTTRGLKSNMAPSAPFKKNTKWPP